MKGMRLTLSDEELKMLAELQKWTASRSILETIKFAIRQCYFECIGQYKGDESHEYGKLNAINVKRKCMLIAEAKKVRIVS